ncbi:hypothetical protein EJ02DRAFT_113731 [Clathrospora elynae]|uniref:Uncharacterized protein n=1 Tax=Clathrospora elynae TaxID=706981 RepID=A0A6A5SZS8_9PLEO|nr:hypothetical protein EJ02DRAFT_113731 [Clathrospora elynae]
MRIWFLVGAVGRGLLREEVYARVLRAIFGRVLVHILVTSFTCDITTSSFPSTMCPPGKLSGYRYIGTLYERFSI